MKKPSKCQSPGDSSISAKENDAQSNRSRDSKVAPKSEGLATGLDETEWKSRLTTPEIVLKEIRTLEGVSYYHGMVARDLVESKLTRCGDYLIRATDNRIMEFEFILSFFNKKRIHSHLTIKCDVEAGKWALGLLSVNQFSSVVDLTNFYKTNPIGAGFFLKRAISKGKYMIAHDRIKYSPKDDLLGTGNFSDVFRGKIELENQMVNVALKTTKLLDDTMDPTKNVKANKIKKEMIQEAEVMSQLRHANVTSFFGIAVDRLPILLIIEFCNGGNLQGHLIKFGDRIGTNERFLYLHDASAGLNYIHAMSITHRDIAARNCLISVNGFVKLSDFGMGLKVRRNESAEKVAEDDDGKENKEPKLPVRWMSPELVDTPDAFSKMSDMWSLGILAYEIFTNATKPFFNLDDTDVMQTVKSGKHPPLPLSMGPDLIRLLKDVLVAAPTQRTTADKFYNELHVLCTQKGALSLNGLTINQIRGISRKRVEHVTYRKLSYAIRMVTREIGVMHHRRCWLMLFGGERSEVSSRTGSF
ncbi:Tyrosine-protein kinase [Caenorhabditis elegans]|uniref:Tyrosine-protein kinase n=1 Tax=Caenorhabditis elegans TaxID=6239 RepID=Q9U2T8_CAEEL|nr:Tyrosine-protein kinase [Caenorhabditis elegans]CAB55139.2 Tyrosine-protein kinase [Caenorhabditis elegans]|eukprot:NP_001255931.1 Tyrosine-protein kinase [Caenorhabditis elegans]